MTENGFVEVESSSFQDALATKFAVFVDSAPIEAGGVGTYIRGVSERSKANEREGARNEAPTKFYTVALQEKGNMTSAMTGSIDDLNSAWTADGKDLPVDESASDVEGIDGASATDKQLIDELVPEAGADLQGCFARAPLFNEPGSAGLFQLGEDPGEMAWGSGGAKVSYFLPDLRISFALSKVARQLSSG
jgi:hypothetical protein